MKYELKENANKVEFVVRTNDDESISWIPLDLANSDYQAYLRWLENPDVDESGTL